MLCRVVSIVLEGRVGLRGAQIGTIDLEALQDLRGRSSRPRSLEAFLVRVACMTTFTTLRYLNADCSFTELDFICLLNMRFIVGGKMVSGTD